MQLLWAHDERADYIDLGQELELDAEAVRQDRLSSHEIRRTVAGGPEVCRDIFNVAPNLLAPTPVQRKEDANQKDGEGNTTDRNAEASPLREEILAGDQ